MSLTPARLLTLIVLFVSTGPVFGWDVKLTKTGSHRGGQNGAIAVGDLDGDGDLDLVITGGGESGTRTSLIYLNDGKGSFKPAESQPLKPLRLGKVALADLDGDKDLDVVITGHGQDKKSHTLVYLNDGKGAFTSTGQDSILGVYEAGSLALDDLDGDGDPDMVLAGRHKPVEYIAEIYLNDGKGTFKRLPSELPGFARGDLKTGDLNGDGRPDIVLMGQSDGNRRLGKVYLNEGKARFSPGPDIDPMIDGSLELADLDGDDDLDLIQIGGRAGGNRATRFYFNDGAGKLSSKTMKSVEDLFTGDIAVADFDGDGDPDLVICGNKIAASCWIGVYENEDGTFVKDRNNRLVGLEFGVLAVGDIDGDGDPDLMTSGRDSRYKRLLRIYRND